MDTAWYDDPIFDDTAEVVDGAFVQGDDWRRLQYCKDEAGGEGEVVKVAGTTHAASAVRHVVARRAAIVPEPENPYDKTALRVEVDGTKVGYVPRGKAVPVNAVARVVKTGMEPQPHLCGSLSVCARRERSTARLATQFVGGEAVEAR